MRRTISASKPTPALNPKRRPLTRPRPIGRRDAARDETGRHDRVAPQPERARKDARPAGREEAERDVPGDAVQHLVVGPVTGEHVDRVDGRLVLAGEARRLARLGRPDDRRARGELRQHAVDERLRDAGRVRVDDQEPAHEAGRVA